jgi:hypothetical protein
MKIQVRGNRKYFTVGAGLKYNTFGLNFSYLVPSGNGISRNPLSNTLRFSLLFDFAGRNNKLINSKKSVSINPERFFVFILPYICSLFKKKYNMSLRIGFGIDFHQLVTDREFWLGGVKIDHPKEHWATAMRMCYCMRYATQLLGAALPGEIYGVHFPDTDASIKKH